jgi:hypothetical protein
VKQPITKGAEIFIEIGSSDKNIGFILPTHHIMEGKEEYEGRGQKAVIGVDRKAILQAIPSRTQVHIP